MQVTVIQPSPRLAPFVARLAIVESEHEVSQVPLGDPGVALGIRYAGAAGWLDGERERRLPDCSITGVLPSARRIHTQARSGLVLAQFHPAGAAAFFRDSMDELTGRTRPLEDLLPRAEVARLADRIASQPTSARRAAVLDGFLLARLRPETLDPIVAAAAAALASSRGVVRIASLARQLGLSQDPLEKRFRRAIGTSPKHLASLLRLRHAIAMGQRGLSWTLAAHQAGYFDQSHFIREFRAYASDTPTRFFRAPGIC